MNWDRIEGHRKQLRKRRHSTSVAAGLACLLAFGLGACDNGGRSAGRKVDEAVNSTERAAAQINSEVKQGAAELKDAVGRVTTVAKQSVSDAAITAAVNAELAKDASLSVLTIEVDTDGGRVALNGTAVDGEASQRATRLAAAVSGVTSVDNRLSVR